MDFIDKIMRKLDDYLDQSAETNEHSLILALAQDQVEPFDALNLKHSKELFNAHFLVRHALFLLQNRYLEERSYLLHIDLTKIRREAYLEASSSLCQHNPVKAYYLDFQNFLDTTEDDVNDLLTQFWRKHVAQESKLEDLAVLGLPADAGHEEVKRKYRQLAQEAHPDKGGNAEEFAKLAQAKSNLDKLY